MPTRVSPVLIVGLGGLGCPVSFALARAGVERLTLLDPDVVDVSNLHRQIWHHPGDVGRPKVDSAREKLERVFPHLSIVAEQRALDAQSAEALFKSHALVVDATDAVDTKFLLSDAAVLTGTPLIYGGVVRFEGLAMRIEPQGPCLRCLFESAPVDAPTCAQAGVLGSMAGLVGGLMAGLALRPNEEPGVAKLHVADGQALAFRTVRVRKRADCQACGGSAKPVLRDARRDHACPMPASTSPVTSAR